MIVFIFELMRDESDDDDDEEEGDDVDRRCM
jgi:hypothetical protein